MRDPRKIFKNPIQEELGFGKNVTTEGRMMNPDGSFNVQRQSTGPWDNVYYYLLNMSWTSFFLMVFTAYVGLNILFATTYMVVGVEQLSGMPKGTAWENFANCFFFSTQTLTTVGYGYMSPNGFAANLISSLESFTGLLAFALISGLLYGRFSRPVARVIFSERILISPYRDGLGLMFRMVNARKSELIDADAQIILAVNQPDDAGVITRRFFPLSLEVGHVSFFSLSWTVVHALNENSPLAGFSQQDLIDANAECLVLVKGVDESNQSTVHTRRSYAATEFVWNARFRPVIARNRRGVPHVLTSMIGAYEELG